MKKIFWIVLVLGFAIVATFFGRRYFSNSGNLGCGEPKIRHHVTDPDLVTLVVPPGSIINNWGNVNLKSHAYIVIDSKAPVYAPIDSTLTEGSFYTEENMNQYALFFDLGCDWFYIFDHIQEPVGKITEVFRNPPQTDTRTENVKKVEFKAGELIGYTTGTAMAHHFDFGVFDRSQKKDLSYLDVEIHGREVWGVCPFDLMIGELASFYRSKFGNLTQEPIPDLYCD